MTLPTPPLDASLEPFTIQGYDFPPPGEWAYVPKAPTNFCMVQHEEKLEVVGESRHLDGIRGVLAAFRKNGEEPNTLFAALVHEPRNPFDRFAVRVDVFAAIVEGGAAHHAKAGYLAREQALLLYEYVKHIADQALLPIISVQVYGGTPDKPNIGLWLGRGQYELSEDFKQI